MIEVIPTIIEITFISTHVFKCCTVGNTARVYKIPKNSLPNLNSIDAFERELLDNRGVYLLFSRNNSDVYVGKTDLHRNMTGILTRLNQHTNEPNFLYAIAIVDSNWGGSDLSYLEHKFWQLSMDAGLHLLNHNEPNDGNLNQAHRQNLDRTIGFICLLMKLMGHEEFDRAHRLH